MVYILYSCFNNYDLLIGENFAFIRKNAHRVILIDDHSTEREQYLGKKFAEKVGCRFEINPSKGVQSAVSFAIKKYCGNEDWVVVMQQDANFLSVTAMSELDQLTDKINSKGDRIGAFGFPNYMPDSHYHKNQEPPSNLLPQNCWLGVFNLSSANDYSKSSIFFNFLKLISKIPKIEKVERRIWQKIIVNRNFAPLTYPRFNEIYPEYSGFVSIELPVWTVVVISAQAWRKVIVTDERFIFHLWFPDIAMQFMNNDYYVCLYSKLIVLNNWRIKPKYNIQGSVEEGKKKDGRMERYGSHFDVWKLKWHYDYEDPFPPQKMNSNPNSVLNLMRNNDPKKPLKIFSYL